MDAARLGPFARPLTLLGAGGLRRTFDPGETVFHQGDGADALHVVQAGHVALRMVTAGGERVTLDVLGAGEVVGEETAVHGGAVHVASAVAVGALTTLALRRPALTQLRTQEAGTDLALLAVSQRRAHARTTHLLDALHAPAETRVLRRLAVLTRRFSDGGDPVVVRSSQSDLADMAGCSRATANRVLGLMDEEGIVRVARNRIEVLDVARLLDRAG